MKNTMFPEIVNQMNQRGEKLKDLVELLDVTDISSVSRKLSGSRAWTIGDIEALCKHYDMGFWELFKRKEK